MTKRKPKPAKPYEEPAYAPFEFVDSVKPGVLLNLKGRDRDEANYKLGTLWVWTRNEQEHLLVQVSHRKHCHRVQAVFWTSVIANAVRKLIEDGMTPKAGGLAVYTMLREAGIAPLTQYRQPSPPKARKKPHKKPRTGKGKLTLDEAERLYKENLLEM
jgi:hypothetical protein